jgi:restriction endonuclease S subunit
MIMNTKDISLDSKINGNILPIIDIVDTLIHSITRRHIPDYPEAQAAIQSIKALILSERSEAAFDEVDILREMQRITRKTTLSYLTKDGEQYINGRCKELTRQSNGGK